MSSTGCLDIVGSLLPRCVLADVVLDHIVPHLSSGDLYNIEPASTPWSAAKTRLRGALLHPDHRPDSAQELDQLVDFFIPDETLLDTILFNDKHILATMIGHLNHCQVQHLLEQAVATRGLRNSALHGGCSASAPWSPEQRRRSCTRGMRFRSNYR